MVTDKGKQKRTVVGKGKNEDKVLTRVHALKENDKINLRGVQQGVRHKHLSRYLAEFCYRFNCRFMGITNV